jgi:DNA (cytosine-5)-methyltransferase 1
MRERARRSNRVPAVPAPFHMIDLFAGCGGLTSGFVGTGRFTPVGAVEHDLAAAATYAANFGEDHIYYGEIEDWVQRPLPAADVVVGGPPCQGFSNLGARRDTDPRNELWRSYVDVLVAVHPRVFVLENVDRFGVSKQFEALRNETERRGKLKDYKLDAHVVRATDFGSAQLRKRFIVIGTHRDLDPIEVPRTRLPVEEWVTVADRLGRNTPDISWDDQDLPTATTQFFGKVVPGVFKSPDLHITRFYTDLSRKRFKRIPTGGNRLNLPNHLKAPCWRNHDKGSLDVMGRMHWDKPSVTIRTEFFKPEKGRYLHPTYHRAITHYEATRLQGFPEEFQWCGSKLQIARQIGNAVPIELAQGLAQHIATKL